MPVMRPCVLGCIWLQCWPGILPLGLHDVVTWFSIGRDITWHCSRVGWCTRSGLMYWKVLSCFGSCLLVLCMRLDLDHCVCMFVLLDFSALPLIIFDSIDVDDFCEICQRMYIQFVICAHPDAIWSTLSISPQTAYLLLEWCRRWGTSTLSISSWL